LALQPPPLWAQPLSLPTRWLAASMVEGFTPAGFTLQVTEGML
jgi:hypothetical protein